MATFLLLALAGSERAVDDLVCSKVAEDARHRIESGKWLLSSPRSTSKELSDEIGLTHLVVAEDKATFLMTPVRGYFGLANPDIWEWLASKSATVMV